MTTAITIHVKHECRRCDGSGKDWPSRKAEKTGDESRLICCPDCGGSGEIEESERVSLGDFRRLLADLEDES